MKLKLTSITTEGRKRIADPAKVDSLAASMAVEGLLQPIGVVFTGPGTYQLCYGLHRYVAAQQLGWEEIPVIELDTHALGNRARARACEGGASEAEIALITDTLISEMAEIDENLIRHELSRVQFDQQNKRRKAIYEILHPETTRQATAERAINTRHGNTDSTKAQAGPKKEAPKTYVADTAEKTGKSETVIKRSLARAEVPNMDKVPETVPVVELDKVASVHGKGVRKEKEAKKLKKEAEAAKTEEVKQRKAEEAAKLEKEAEELKADAQIKLEVAQAKTAKKEKKTRAAKAPEANRVEKDSGGTTPKPLATGKRKEFLDSFGYFFETMQETAPLLTDAALEEFWTRIVELNRWLALAERT